MEQTFLTLNEIQDRYGVSRQTVTNWINRNSFPTPIKVGRSKRWNISDVTAWEKMNRVDVNIEFLDGLDVWKDEDLAEKLKTILLKLLNIRDTFVGLEPQIQNRGMHRKILDITQKLFSTRELVNEIQQLKSRGLVLDYPSADHVDDDLF